MNKITEPEKLTEIIKRESPGSVYVVIPCRNYSSDFSKKFFERLRESRLPFVCEAEFDVGIIEFFLPSRILPVYLVDGLDYPAVAVTMPKIFSNHLSRRFNEGEKENLLRPTFVTSANNVGNMEHHVPRVLEYIAEQGFPHRICVEN